jgi:hypothetical protein
MHQLDHLPSDILHCMHLDGNPTYAHPLPCFKVLCKELTKGLNEPIWGFYSR